MISDFYFVIELAGTISCIILPQHNQNNNFCFHPSQEPALASNTEQK